MENTDHAKKVGQVLQKIGQLMKQGGHAKVRSGYEVGGSGHVMQKPEQVLKEGTPSQGKTRSGYEGIRSGRAKVR